MQLSELQAEAAAWHHRNFGEAVPYKFLLGIVEEVGELAHAELKGIQRIRYTPAQVRAKKMDAVGDVIIFLANYCTASGLSLPECLERTWEVVSRRDWRENPLGAADGG